MGLHGQGYKATVELRARVRAKRLVVTRRHHGGALCTAALWKEEVTLGLGNGKGLGLGLDNAFTRTPLGIRDRFCRERLWFSGLQWGLRVRVGVWARAVGGFRVQRIPKVGGVISNRCCK